jgi:hypothetical protein
MCKTCVLAQDAFLQQLRMFPRPLHVSHMQLPSVVEVRRSPAADLHHTEQLQMACKGHGDFVRPLAAGSKQQQ